VIADTNDPGNTAAKPIPVVKRLTHMTKDDMRRMREQHELQKIVDRNEDHTNEECWNRCSVILWPGNYASALSSIDSEEVDLVRSSDGRFDFSSDLIFFKNLALTQYLTYSSYPVGLRRRSAIEGTKLGRSQ
jgi:hypothetical protein